MNDDKFSDLKIANILSSVKTIAVVGASNNWKRPSNFVMKYLQRKGYKIIPVNPKEAGKEIHNELCYASLKDIPINIDMLDNLNHECWILGNLFLLLLSISLIFEAV